MTGPEGFDAPGVIDRPWRIRVRRRIRHALRPAKRRLGLLPPGSNYVLCSRGHKHWGLYGAAGTLVVAGDSDSFSVLLGRRSAVISHPGTWGIPGGARDTAVEPWGNAAYRELAEETGLDLTRLAWFGESVVDHGVWQYRTQLVAWTGPLDELPEVTPLDDETTEFRWVPSEEVERLALHPGFAKFWADRLRAGVL